MLQSGVEQMYRIETSKRGSVVVSNDELSHSCHMRAAFATLSGHLQRIWAYVQLCDVAEYMKLGAVFVDFTTIEKRLDAFLELLRSDSISLATPIKDIELSIRIAEGFATAATASAAEPAAVSFLESVLLNMDIGADDSFILIRQLHIAVQSAAQADEQLDLSALVGHIAALNKFNKTVQVLSRKCKRRMDELAADGKRVLLAPFQQPLEALRGQLTKIKASLTDLSTSATATLSSQVRYAYVWFGRLLTLCIS